MKNKLFEYISRSDKNIILKIFSKDIYDFLKESINLPKNNDNNELKEILQYYQQYYPQTKKEDINLINNYITNNNGNKEQYVKYLTDLDEARKMNLKTPFIKKLLNKNNYKE